MGAISATVFATLGCQACSHLDASYAAPALPVHMYEVPKMVPTSDIADTRMSYSGQLLNIEAIPRAGFEAVDAFTGPIEISGQLEDALSNQRLYSSETLARAAGERAQNDLSAIPRQVRKLTAEMSLSAPAERTGLGLDVGLAPRVSYSRDGDFATRRVGGEVRIGQNFDKRGESDGAAGWYLFAGGDGEALVWEPGEANNLVPSQMALRDKVTVGDMQAGVTFQQGPGQVSFSYIQREVEYRERNLGGSDSEQFAGVTFTIRK